MITKEKYLEYQLLVDEISQTMKILQDKKQNYLYQMHDFRVNQPRLPIDKLPKFVKIQNGSSTIFKYRPLMDDYYCDNGMWSFNYRLTEYGELVVHYLNEKQLDGYNIIECDENGKIIDNVYYNKH